MFIPEGNPGLSGNARRKPTKCDRSAAVPLAGTKCGGYKPAVWSRSVAQPGSAPRSGRGGRRFKSCHSDQRKQRVSASRLRRSACPSSEITRVPRQSDGRISIRRASVTRPTAMPVALDSNQSTGRLMPSCVRSRTVSGKHPDWYARPPQRRPKKLKIAITMTTAPTSQMILFIISLLLPGKPAPLAENAGRPAFAD